MKFNYCAAIIACIDNLSFSFLMAGSLKLDCFKHSLVFQRLVVIEIILNNFKIFGFG